MTKTPPTIAKNSPFYRPKEPRNSWEILKWLVFEPILLQEYEDTLEKDKHESVCENFFYDFGVWLLYFLVLGTWLISTYLIIYFNSYLNIFNICFPSESYTFLMSWQFLLKETTPSLFWGTLSIVILFLVKFRLGIVNTFSIGLTIVISPIIVWILGYSLDNALYPRHIAMIYGSVLGLCNGFVIGINPIAMLGYENIFKIILAVFLTFFWNFGIQELCVFIFGYSLLTAFVSWRLYLYPIYQIKSFYKKKLNNNIYLKDAHILFPIAFLHKDLIFHAKKQPILAQKFLKFLISYRPFQKALILELIHTIKGNQLLHHPLKSNVLTFPIYVPPQKRFLSFILLFKSEKLAPSERWFTQLENLQKRLQVHEKHTNIALQKSSLEQFNAQLIKFHEQTLSENPAWNKYYLPALDIWKTRTEELLADLTQQAQILEPITSNVYRAGEALEPSLNGAIFRGRNDLKDALTTFILTETQMPTLLLYGQRRVGKTSFLKFLPTILDYNFKVIYTDCQDTQNHTIAGFLSNIRQKANQLFSNKASETWQVPTHWATAWTELAKHLSSLCQGKDCKLIIALDEYEDLHNHVLTKDVAQAQELLGAMRSFSQHQKEVVLLFVGVAVFTDLQHPSWISYFPHVKVKKIDYLPKADTLKLITQPTDDFNVTYPTEVPERIYHLTQGHPNLVQLICQGLVEIANSTGRKQLGKKDLEAALEEKVLGRQNGVIDVFWFDFCRTELQKQVIQAIVHQEAMPKKSKPVLRRFLDYGFIVKDGDGYRMRVPLFQEWLEDYAE